MSCEGASICPAAETPTAASDRLSSKNDAIAVKERDESATDSMKPSEWSPTSGLGKKRGSAERGD